MLKQERALYDVVVGHVVADVYDSGIWRVLQNVSFDQRQVVVAPTKIRGDGNNRRCPFQFFVALFSFSFRIAGADDKKST